MSPDKAIDKTNESSNPKEIRMKMKKACKVLTIDTKGDNLGIIGNVS